MAEGFLQADSTTQDVALKTLINQIEDGHFAVPKLQRAFVWNGEKAALLLDSIVRGLPVGAVTVWNAKQKNSHQLPNTLHILPQPRKHHQTVKFVLDGQQRLSVLYHVFKGSTQQNQQRQTVDFRRIVLRVKPNEHGRHVEYRKPIDKIHTSLSDLLSARWKRKLGGLSKARLRALLRLRAQLTAYRLTVITYNGQELEEARDLFVRINSSGTPLASADRAFALAQRVDLRAKTKALIDQLNPKFGAITAETVLQTLALATGIEDVGKRALTEAAKRWEKEAEAGRLREFEKVWAGVSKGILAAVDTLQSEFGVHSDAVLPSQLMIATLAQYHAERATLTTKVRKEVRAWFWASALGQRYSGRGFRTNVKADAKLFRDLAEGKALRFNIRERISPMELRSAKYGTRSSIADALMLLLALEKPRDLLDGKEILLKDQFSATAKLHRHHVFPRKLLSRNKVPHGAANSILNLCLVRADSNSRFHDWKPWEYLHEIHKSRWFRGAMKRSLLPDLFSDDHFDKDVKKSYSLFLGQRAELVMAAFEKRAGRRLFARD